MNRRNLLKSSFVAANAVLLPAGVIALSGCNSTAAAPERLKIGGRIMGTGYSVQLGPNQAGTVPLAGNADALKRKVHATLEKIDAQMSTWRSDSELSRFNASQVAEWTPMSTATTQVIAKAIETSRACNGAFDVTIGSLVELWGFGSSSVNTGKPASDAIGKALDTIGYDAIEVDAANRLLRKDRGVVRLDLSGIAKGYAVDQVSLLLDGEGYDSYLVEIGGEIKCRGTKAENRPWKVAIEKPLTNKRDAFRVISLNGRAVATSGDYRNFFIDGGKRYSHSIDPRSGKPVSHNLASVTVVAEEAMTADALSTALMIMGPNQAMNYAQSHNIAAHFIVKGAAGLSEYKTSEFESVLI